MAFWYIEKPRNKISKNKRGGILSISEGQTEGAKAIGMNHIQTMLYIIIP